MVQFPGLLFTQILSAQATLTYIKKVKLAVQSNPPNSPWCKTQGGFFSLHHLLSVRVIWVWLPAVMQHLQLCGSPSKHIISLQPCAPLQCSAPVLAAELLWEENTPSAFPLGLQERALHGLLPANCWEWLLEAEQFQCLHSPGTHCIFYQQLI